MGIMDKIITVILLIAVIYMIGDMYLFKNTGKRFTYCDGVIHEYVYHGQELLDECKIYDNKTNTD